MSNHTQSDHTTLPKSTATSGTLRTGYEAIAVVTTLSDSLPSVLRGNSQWLLDALTEEVEDLRREVTSAKGERISFIAMQLGQSLAQTRTRAGQSLVSSLGPERAELLDKSCELAMVWFSAWSSNPGIARA